MAKPRHVPLRTCVGCGSERPKRELARVVRTLDLQVRLDTTGKQSGRGVYVCLSRRCLEVALRKQRLLQALAKGLEEEDRRRLRWEAGEPERLTQWIVQREAQTSGGGR